MLLRRGFRVYDPVNGNKGNTLHFKFFFLNLALIASQVCHMSIKLLNENKNETDDVAPFYFFLLFLNSKLRNRIKNK